MVGLETALALALDKLYHGGYLTLEEIAAKMSMNPAKVLRQDWSGITPGGRADLVLFQLDETWTICPEKFRSKGRNTPFGGMEVRGRTAYTIAGGKVVYRRDEDRKDGNNDVL